jgi:hypothetical protein
MRDPGETVNWLHDEFYKDALKQFRLRRSQLGF